MSDFPPPGERPEDRPPPPSQLPPPPPPAPVYGQPPAYGQPPVYGPPPAYGGAGYGYTPYATTGRTNGMAIASLVLGILWLDWIGSALALIFGYVALGQIKRRQQKGRGLAIAGITLGWIGVALLVLVIVLAVSGTGNS